jgi:hypothetical protein
MNSDIHPSRRAAQRASLVATTAAYLVLLCSYAAADAAETKTPTDVIPPLATQSPRLRFHLGEIVGNQPLISPILPNMPDLPSPWYVCQWGQRSYVQPTLIADTDHTGDVWRDDPKFGRPTYAFAAPDGHATVRIFGHLGAWTYELAQSGGILTEGGGSNLFLAADATDPRATFDRPITYDID